MRLASVTFKPLLEVEFTREDVEALIKGAESHYDDRCRSTVERPDVIGIFPFKRYPEQGLLVALRNMFECEPKAITTHWPCSCYDLQTLGKIAESPLVPPTLYGEIMDLLRQHAREYDRVNGPTR